MAGLFGILLAWGLFLFLAFKGFDLVLSSVVLSFLMCLFNFPLQEACQLLTGTFPSPESLANTGFMVFFAGFLRDYFLLFLLSALFGQLLYDSGAARCIAEHTARLVRLARPSMQKFFCALIVPFLYSVLSYAGISGFVIVFTIMPIARDLFRETDTPWAFYCFGGPQVLGVTMLAGSLQATNIHAANICGTSLTAGAALSFCAYGVWVAVTLLVIRTAVRRADRRGEHFSLCCDAAGQDAAHEASCRPASPLLPALLPLLVTVAAAVIRKDDVIPALCCGCVLCVALFRRELAVKWKSAVSKGTADALRAISTVAATYAMGSVMKLCPSFGGLIGAMDALPGLAGGSILMMGSSFVMASSLSATAAFGSTISERFLEAGLSASVSHRLMTLSCFTSLSPHNSGVINASAVTKIPYSRCLKIYMIGSLVPGFAAFFTAILLITTGLIA